MVNNTIKKQAALRQVALTKRRKEQGLTRLQVWVTDEQKQKVLAMLQELLKEQATTKNFTQQ